MQAGVLSANEFLLRAEEDFHSNLHRYIDAAQQGEINPYADLEGFLEKAKEAQHLFPVSALHALNDFKLHKGKDSYLLWRNLPYASHHPHS